MVVAMIIHLEPRLAKKLNSNKETALHVAVQNNRIDTVKFLIKNCELILNFRDTSGNTALHYAVENNGVADGTVASALSPLDSGATVDTTVGAPSSFVATQIGESTKVSFTDVSVPRSPSAFGAAVPPSSKGILPTPLVKSKDVETKDLIRVLEGDPGPWTTVPL
ncbi:hypothetical protein QJS10_CPA06g00751 [Acorus calamus]|uniref:Uncharacterized protein n=1 Tax=Acorus calamus TaxID=4465 RepID=A0AAV9EKR4_ACOCL|nr:hypothetical protein QJS10_CPA06g00751 [Acorus calamus]